MASRLLPLVVALTLGLSGSVVAADAGDPTDPTVSPSVHDVADQCRQDGRDERECRSWSALATGAGHVCRYITPDAAGDEVCAYLNGELITDDLVAEYEASATAEAHRLQRQLMLAVPLADSLVLSTHNSFNNASRRPSLSGLDANHQWSMVDQLRMDIRGLELDVHTFPSLEGGGVAPIMCHGGLGIVGHEGCTIEEPFATALADLRVWLDANPGDVIILEIEDHMDGDDGHAAGVAALESTMGSAGGAGRDLLWRPGDAFGAVAGGTCVGLPLDHSLDEVREAGRQVVVFSSCAGGGWNDIAFSNGGPGGPSPGGRRTVNGQVGDGYSYPGCNGGYDADRPGWVRHHEDSTWLSRMAGAAGPPVTPAVASAMVQCGVNMPSFDQWSPSDGRLTTTLWSWTAESAVPAEGDCGAHDGSDRFAAQPCGTPLGGAACWTGMSWTVVTGSFTHLGADAACAEDGGSLGMPRTPLENQALGEAKAAAEVSDVWLDLTAVVGAAGPAWVLPS